MQEVGGRLKFVRLLTVTKTQLTPDFHTNVFPLKKRLEEREGKKTKQEKEYQKSSW